MTLGKQIQLLRKEIKITQDEFASMFYVTRQTVSNWENDKCYPDIHTLVAISERFNISLDTLIKGDIVMFKAETIR